VSRAATKRRQQLAQLLLAEFDLAHRAKKANETLPWGEFGSARRDIGEIINADFDKRAGGALKREGFRV